MFASLRRLIPNRKLIPKSCLIPRGVSEAFMGPGNLNNEYFYPGSCIGKNPLYWAATEVFMERPCLGSPKFLEIERPVGESSVPSDFVIKYPQRVEVRQDTKKRKIYNKIIDKFLTINNDAEIQKKFLLLTFFHQYSESDPVNHYLFDYIKEHSSESLQPVLELTN